MTESELFAALNQNDCAQFVLENAGALNLQDWYLGAGAVCQTIWNLQHGFPPSQNISDLDLVYFDASDISKEAEHKASLQAQELFSNFATPVEVINQARVHCWYAEQFGFAIQPYTSTEQAIATWPTTASSIGVRMNPDRSVKVCAPFGLSDIFEMIVRPNKRMVTRQIYESKALKWKMHWPELKIVSWD